jgi:hypothetical protein
MGFSYEENQGKGHYGLDGLQTGCGIEMGPKACDDEMNLPDGRETYGDLRT